jgi:hypothetical protein
MRMNSRPVRFAVGGALLLSLAGGAFAQTLPIGQPVQRLTEEYPREKRLEELHAMISHEDHSIDILNSEQPDPRGNRHRAIEEITHARDAMQRIVDEMEHRGPERDVDRDHRRDEERKHEDKPPTYYGGLIVVHEYLKNDTITLTRHPADPNHHRGNALEAMEKAHKFLEAEMEDYRHIHPDAR